MKKFAHISSHEASVPFAVEGSTRFIDSVLDNDFWEEYVIGELREVDSPSRPEASVEIIEYPVPSFNPDTRVILCDETTAASGIKFVSHFLERERQRDGMYTVHGNVISLGEKAIALVGGISGIGKTTLSANASREDWEWTADEKFLMNESGYVIGGLKSIQNDSKTFEAASDRRPATVTDEREIAGFVIPIVTNQDLVSHLYEESKSEYHLYEEMGRNITASRAFLRGYDTPLPSVDTPDIARRRYTCAKNLTSRVPMYFMMGTSAQILEACESIIDN